MRKIIVTEFITLDGSIEAPGGDETAHPNGGWQMAYGRDPEAGKYKADELAGVDALMLGRITYEHFAKYWPHQTEGAFATRMNELPKYIVSRSLQKAEWINSHIISDMATDIATLKQSNGGNILVYGSGTLVRSLLHDNLIDELRLMLYPVSIGGGVKIFDDNRELKKFQLTNSRTFHNGVLLLEYRPIRS